MTKLQQQNEYVCNLYQHLLPRLEQITIKAFLLTVH